MDTTLSPFVYNVFSVYLKCMSSKAEETEMLLSLSLSLFFISLTVSDNKSANRLIWVKFRTNILLMHGLMHVIRATVYGKQTLP